MLLQTKLSGGQTLQQSFVTYCTGKWEAIVLLAATSSMGFFLTLRALWCGPDPGTVFEEGGQCQGATNQGGKEQCKICSLFSLTSNPVFLPERVLAASCSWKAFAICPDCSGSCSCTYRVTGVVRCPSQSPCVSFLCSCGVWLPFSTTSAL